MSIAKMKPSQKRIVTLQKTIFTWWTAHRRELPWRNTHNPYAIFVSELMLQQTQVSRVLPVYTKFLALFPDVTSLARASTADVLKAWKGMGYNRRALYLKKTAKAVMEKHGGIFPETEQALLALPGIGKYTARAILVFAFRQDIAMVDTNIRQIIMHFFFDGKPQKESFIQNIADQLVPVGKSWEWHQALMDYGSLEMPRLKIFQPKQKKKSTIAFRESNRFYRGRIIDTLRDGCMTRALLLQKIATTYDKSRDALNPILDQLHTDGLVSIINDRVCLPQ